MKLYLITQTVNKGYDTYDSAVVSELNTASAKYTHPNGTYFWTDRGWAYENAQAHVLFPIYHSWAEPADVQVKYLGEAVEGTKPGVICASFNAG